MTTLSEQPPPYVETPEGLFTAGGVWFRTTAAAVRAYAGPVLERRPLEALLGDAQVWLHLPQVLTLWILPLLLLWVSPGVAAAAAVAILLILTVFSPPLVSPGGVAGVRILQRVLLQAVFYVGALSWLAQQGRLGAVGVGLGAFILIRWGVAGRVAGWLAAPLLRRFSALPPPDQILRALIQRTALRYHLPLPDVEAIEQDVLRFLHRS